MRCTCRRGAPECDELGFALLPALLGDAAAIRWSWRMTDPRVARGVVRGREERELELATKAREVLERHGYDAAISGPDWDPTIEVRHRPCSSCRGVAA